MSREFSRTVVTVSVAIMCSVLHIHVDYVSVVLQIHSCTCWWLPTVAIKVYNYRQFVSYGKEVGHHKVGQ